jgi:two-component system nitrate/nitrite response regulator NarL
MTETARRSDRTRVILADPDPIARGAVRAAFDAADDFLVTAETRAGVEAAELAAHYRPDLVLLATDLPTPAGPAACRRIVERAPGVGILMLAPAPAPDCELDALRVGASGLVAKTAGTESILTAARAVGAGQLALSPEVARVLVDRLRMVPESGVGMRPVRSALTAREWEVIDLLTVERTTAEIAAELYLAPDTVKSHVKSIMRKLGVHTRTEAVQRAARLRWVLPTAA